MGTIVRVLAKIRLFRTEEGGRRNGIASGYRPPFRFGDLYADGAIDFIDRERAEPGDECEVHIRFPQPEYIEEFLKPGQAFDITEGPQHKVGEGKIVKVGV